MCLRHAGLQDVFDVRRCEDDESCPVAEMVRKRPLLTQISIISVNEAAPYADHVPRGRCNGCNSDYQSQLALYASAIKAATAKQVSAVLLRSERQA